MSLVWQSVLLVLGAVVLRMTLLRCPKFLRCLTADAGNFDRGHSLTSLHLPLAALGSLPTSSRLPHTSCPLHRGGRPCPPARTCTTLLVNGVIARPVRKLVVAIRAPSPCPPYIKEAFFPFLFPLPPYFPRLYISAPPCYTFFIGSPIGRAIFFREGARSHGPQATIYFHRGRRV